MIRAAAWALALALATSAGAIAAENPSPYHPARIAGECGGLPRVVLTTPPESCVGLVASGLRYPRGVLPLTDGRIVVAEMGNWSARRGAIVALVPESRGRYRREVWIEGLDRPHGLALGPDGKIYAGEVGRILRFSLADPKATLQTVVGPGGEGPSRALPTDGRHPLVSLVFDARGDLFVNIGSASDNCEPVGRYPGVVADRCPEADGDDPRGAIRRYRMHWPEGTVVDATLYARGLRNSLALAFHPRTGVLWQADNARDNLRAKMAGLADDEDVPRDELNEIVDGGHYGWPYCHDAASRAPEFAKVDCARYRKPALLLPGHAAPLGMIFVVAGQSRPAHREDGLIIGFHGYRRNGHRVMFYSFDPKGRPNGRSVPLISDWDNPLGAPVDLKLDSNGHLYITEDRNGTLLRLQPAR